MSNHLELKTFWANTPAEDAATRANAVFIYSKMVAAGVDAQVAKAAVEQLYNDGFTNGELNENFNASEDQ